MSLDQTGLELGHFLSYLSQRQEVIASNIANADTPNYKARDVDFSSTLAGALRKTDGSSTGTALRPMPVKICDVAALSCTSAGVERGSNAGNRRWPENVKADATAGCALISDRNSSRTARHSTRAAEIAGVLNSSALTPAATAGSRRKDASRCVTNRSALVPKCVAPRRQAFPVA